MVSDPMVMPAYAANPRTCTKCTQPSEQIARIGVASVVVVDSEHST